ncbi:putative ribonuclease H-like domain-containing protein, partial [Tanacetum coccineum]
PKFNSVRSNINTGRTNISSGRPKVNTVSPKVNSARPTSNRTSTEEQDQLEDFEEFNGGSVTFGGSKGYISGKGRIRVGNLDFDSVSFVKELGHFNLFSISQICDKQHKDETSGILQTFIRQIENQLSHSVKIIRSDNGTEFKNRDMLEFCEQQVGIKLEIKLTMQVFQRKLTMQVLQLLLRKKMRKWRLLLCLQLSRFLKKKVVSRTTSQKFKERETLTEPQKEMKDSSTNPKIQAFRRELEEIALKHLGNVPENNTTSTNSLNTGSQTVNTDVQTRARWNLKKITEDLQDDSWVKDMQEELLQFMLQKYGFLWIPTYGMKVDCSKWVYRYKEMREIEEVFVSHILVLWIYDSHNKVYKVVKALYGLHQAPRAWYATLSTFLEKHGYKRGTIDKTLFIKRDKKDIMLVQVFTSQAEQGRNLHISRHICSENFKKFDLVNVKATITTLWRDQLPLTKVTPKTSHLNAVKRIFKYLKGKPNLGLWYPRESPFDLEAFSDSDYGGSNLDRKSTTGWSAANCCGQVLWVQNQLLDYGFNFMNTKIHIDNESTICIVKNPVYHSKTKHIEIRHHFIRDCYEKKLISVEKIHTDLNVADLHSMDEREECQGFAEIVDFLRGSNLRYALTANPTIYDSLVKQFWQSAIARTKEDGSLEISATIDTIRYTISEASIRDSLQLDDATGITMLPNDDLFEGMGQIGYPTDGTFTFWKSFFTPQWRYLVHHLLHCISSKSGGWDQFGSNIATALICLSTGRAYNFSKLIFDGMVANLKSKKKFLMYPRFLQMILNIQTENKHPYLAVSLTKKIFGNMKRGFQGAPRPLLPSMLLVAINPNAGQEHAAQAPSQPSSSCRSL